MEQITPEVIAAVGVVVATVIVLAVLAKPSKTALGSDDYKPFPLIEKENISHDTRRFRFGLQSPSTKLGLPIGQHISMRFVDAAGKVVSRSYTPTSSDDELGYVDFVIKVYFPNVHPKFPDGGKMSFHLENMKIGDTLDMRGPKGKLAYKGKGKFTITSRKGVDLKVVKKIGMVAGGTGITPMLQIINAIIKEGSTVEMSLIFANQTEEDILLRDMIEDLAAKNKNFSFHYTVDKAPTKWDYSTGFVDEKMCKEHLPGPASDVMLLMCGPPPMIKFACIPAFEKLGFKDTQYFAF